MSLVWAWPSLVLFGRGCFSNFCASLCSLEVSEVVEAEDREEDGGEVFWGLWYEEKGKVSGRWGGRRRARLGWWAEGPDGKRIFGRCASWEYGEPGCKDECGGVFSSNLCCFAPLNWPVIAEEVIDEDEDCALVETEAVAEARFSCSKEWAVERQGQINTGWQRKRGRRWMRWPRQETKS